MKTIGRDFIVGTYGENMSESPQRLGLPQPPLELPIPPGARLVPLPDPEELTIPPVDLRAAIERRRTTRRYAEQPLALHELSYLLWLTQGVKEITKRPATLRTVPSAGARHAFETYLLVNRVEDLDSGLYRFAASQHALLSLPAPATMRQEITTATYEQRQVFDSAVTFLWVAITERMTWRYVERGYRYLYLDAGHVCQNLYLAAEAVGCGVCAMAAYNDQKLNAVLDLDGDQAFVIYLASVGKKRTGE